MRKFTFLLLLLISFNCFVKAQTKLVSVRYPYELVWSSPKITNPESPNVNKQLYFEGATFENSKSLPVFSITVDKINNRTIPHISLINAVYSPLSTEENDLINSRSQNLGSEIEITSQVVYYRKKELLNIQFVPIRKNPVNGNYEKLISFDFSYNYALGTKMVDQKAPKTNTYASHSILKSGNWYCFEIYNTGVYKITKAELQSMGVNLNGVNPADIRIYGNGGSALSENNASQFYDDLVENAIFVYGESDGVFNDADYILFYAKGTYTWTVNDSIFIHEKNPYINGARYFITTSMGAGKRIQSVSTSSLPSTYQISTFNSYGCHENDSLNFILSGREFYGELFDTKTSYTFNLSFPNVVSGSKMTVRTNLLSKSLLVQTNFNMYANDSYIGNLIIANLSGIEHEQYANTSTGTFKFGAVDNLNLKFNYNKSSNPNAKGWLDYFAVNAKRNLIFTSGQMQFRSIESVGKGVCEFVINNVNSNTVFWNITDFLNPQSFKPAISGNEGRFKFQTDSLLEFVAFDGTSFYSISPIGQVPNQDLHGLAQQDFIIVSHPDFLSQAERLADLHRTKDTMSVVVVTPQQVFNEFSSGNQDPTAIKRFVKMFYDRAGSNTNELPDYLLLFGDSSYDCLDRVDNNTNKVIIYQTVNSLAETISFATDDYYGFLDDFEYGAINNRLDIGVGRLPVNTLEEATAVVNKIINYCADYDLNKLNAQCLSGGVGISNFADWRNIVSMVADDNDNNETFAQECEVISKMLDTIAPNWNIDKIYLDAFPQISGSGVQTSPQTNLAISSRVERGALVVNYLGHGGEIGWAHEGILKVSEINSWLNKYNLALFVTGTCEFSRCDDPKRVSAGEMVLLNPNGGGVALFSTIRLAYTSTNASLNLNFFQNLFTKVGGKYPRLGDVVMIAKNSLNCASSISNFLLLGDPALRLAYPQYNVLTTEINSHPVSSLQDTIKALSKVTIKGRIADADGNLLSGYNGIIVPAIYDKASTISTLGTDNTPVVFKERNNILYKGNVEVKNGEFSFTFVVPKDISYEYGKGKISYYAFNGNTDANGSYQDFIVGGHSGNTITDNQGPEIKIYMNDSKFVSGGITSTNPLLLCEISDTAGINTVGIGVGHDLVAVLDGETDNTINLNDYYTSNLNTYKNGTAKYPFKNLAVGDHKVRVKAWDIYNNSSDNEINFVVAENANMALDHVFNYPNPFTTYTEFWFEHNQPCCYLDVQIQIFTISGKLIKTITTTVQTNGFRADPIPWDGKDEFGDAIGKGVYMYKLRVRGKDGLYADKLEKLVILK